MEVPGHRVGRVAFPWKSVCARGGGGSSCASQLLLAEIFVFQCVSVSPVTFAPLLEALPVLGSPSFLHRSYWIRALVRSRKAVTTSFTDKVAVQGVEGSRLQPVFR